MKLYVDDLIPEKISELLFLFILESPYLEEICNKVPLAGKSGKAISKLLHSSIDSNIKNDTPFGIYLKENKDNRFGIINCSNKPMDKKVYKKYNKNEAEIKILNRIRKNPNTKSGNRNLLEDNEMHKKLLANLSKKIFNLHKINNNFIIISCGALSNSFIREISNEINKNHEIINLPHPSFNLWDRKSNKTKINKLIQVLNKHIK
jgi:hypothetical protein